MKKVIPILFVILLSTTSTAQVMQPRHIPNQNINFAGFATLVNQLEPLREAYRISEAEFIEMSKDKDTVVLDTRSAAKYAVIRVREICANERCTVLHSDAILATGAHRRFVTIL